MTATARIQIGSCRSDVTIATPDGDGAVINLMWGGNDANVLLAEAGFRRTNEWGQTIGNGIGYGAEWHADVEPTNEGN